MILASCGSRLGGVILGLIIAGMVYLCKKGSNEPAINVFEMPTLRTMLEEEEDDADDADYEARLEATRNADENLFSIETDSNDSLGLNIEPYSIENQQQQSQEEQQEQYISDTLSETATGYSTNTAM